MNHQDLIYTSVFEQIQRLLFSDLSGPLKVKNILQFKLLIKFMDLISILLEMKTLTSLIKP